MFLLSADNFRPYITSFQGNNCTDYINAVFVDVSLTLTRINPSYTSLMSRVTRTPVSTSWLSGPWWTHATTCGPLCTIMTAVPWWCSVTPHPESQTATRASGLRTKSQRSMDKSSQLNMSATITTPTSGEQILKMSLTFYIFILKSKETIMKIRMTSYIFLI